MWMSNNYFIGDTHFCHGGVSERFRTHFNSDAEHDDTIFENIMECAGKRNNIFLLGDIVFKQAGFWRIYEIAKNFQSVHYIMGNHDPRSVEVFCRQAGLDNVHFYGVTKRYGLWLSHAPMHPQELYRGKSIHGHVHTKTVPHSDYFNVSCENIDYRPISLLQIRERLAARDRRSRWKTFVAEYIKKDPDWGI